MVNDKHIQIIRSIINDYDNKELQLALISGYSSLSISDEEIRNICQDEFLVLYHQYNNGPDIMHSAYEPFLEWIYNCYHGFFEKEMTIDEFLDNAKVYPVIKKTFSYYLQYKQLRRFEGFIYFQSICEYEELRFIKSLTSIIQLIANKRKICIMLDKIHFAGASTIRVLLELYKNKSLYNSILVFCTYREDFRISTYMRNEWNIFIEKCSNDDSIYEARCNPDDEDQVEHDTFFYFGQDCNKHLRTIKDMMNTSAYSQAVYYTNELFSSIIEYAEADELAMDIKCFYEICFLDAFCKAYSGLLKEAKSVVDYIDRRLDRDYNMLNRHDNRFLSECKYKLYYITYWLNMDDMSKYVQAYHYAKAAAEYAVDIKDEKKQFYAEVAKDITSLMYVEWFFPSDNVYQFDVLSPEYYEKMIKKAIDMEDLSVAAVYYALAFENTKDFLQRVEYEKAEFTEFPKAIKLLSKVDNMHLLSHLHNFKSLQAYHYEFNNVAIKINRLCNEYMDREDDRIVENGYSYSLKEQYDISHNVNEKKLNYLYKRYIASKNDVKGSIEFLQDNYYLSEMAGTLLDMAKDNVYMHHYKKAREIITVIILIIDNINKTGLFNASRGLLYSIRAFCYYKEGKIYKTYEDIDRSEAFFEHIIYGNRQIDEDNLGNASVDTFYYFLVKGLLAIY
ncbi:MAG: hypothetical protein K6G26_07840 [Lachnospiraceae bacterium]|nr:hypothetical protein [Lachnospiraceae bacterium]